MERMYTCAVLVLCCLAGLHGQGFPYSGNGESKYSLDDILYIIYWLYSALIPLYSRTNSAVTFD